MSKNKINQHNYPEQDVVVNKEYDAIDPPDWIPSVRTSDNVCYAFHWVKKISTRGTPEARLLLLDSDFLMLLKIKKEPFISRVAQHRYIEHVLMQERNAVDLVIKFHDSVNEPSLHIRLEQHRQNVLPTNEILKLMSYLRHCQTDRWLRVISIPVAVELKKLNRQLAGSFKKNSGYSKPPQKAREVKSPRPTRNVIVLEHPDEKLGLTFQQVEDGRVFITHIEPNSAASRSGVHSGELVSFNAQPASEFVAETERRKQSRTTRVPIVIKKMKFKDEGFQSQAAPVVQSVPASILKVEPVVNKIEAPPPPPPPPPPSPPQMRTSPVPPDPEKVRMSPTPPDSEDHSSSSSESPPPVVLNVFDIDPTRPAWHSNLASIKYATPQIKPPRLNSFPTVRQQPSPSPESAASGSPSIELVGIPAPYQSSFRFFNTKKLHFFGTGSVASDDDTSSESKIIILTDTALYICSKNGRIIKCVPSECVSQLRRYKADGRLEVVLEGGDDVVIYQCDRLMIDRLAMLEGLAIEDVGSDATRSGVSFSEMLHPATKKGLKTTDDCAAALDASLPVCDADTLLSTMCGEGKVNNILGPSATGADANRSAHKLLSYYSSKLTPVKSSTLNATLAHRLLSDYIQGGESPSVSKHSSRARPSSFQMPDFHTQEMNNSLQQSVPSKSFRPDLQTRMQELERIRQRRRSDSLASASQHPYEDPPRFDLPRLSIRKLQEEEEFKRRRRQQETEERNRDARKSQLLEEEREREEARRRREDEERKKMRQEAEEEEDRRRRKREDEEAEDESRRRKREREEEDRRRRKIREEEERQRKRQEEDEEEERQMEDRRRRKIREEEERERKRQEEEEEERQVEENRLRKIRDEEERQRKRQEEEEQQQQEKEKQLHKLQQEEEEAERILKRVREEEEERERIQQREEEESTWRKNIAEEDQQRQKQRQEEEASFQLKRREEEELYQKQQQELEQQLRRHHEEEEEWKLKQQRDEDEARQRRQREEAEELQMRQQVEEEIRNKREAEEARWERLRAAEESQKQRLAETEARLTKKQTEDETRRRTFEEGLRETEQKTTEELIKRIRQVEYEEQQKLLHLQHAEEEAARKSKLNEEEGRKLEQRRQEAESVEAEIRKKIENDREREASFNEKIRRFEDQKRTSRMQRGNPDREMSLLFREMFQSGRDRELALMGSLQRKRSTSRTADTDWSSPLPEDFNFEGLVSQPLDSILTQYPSMCFFYMFFIGYLIKDCLRKKKTKKTGFSENYHKCVPQRQQELMRAWVLRDRDGWLKERLVKCYKSGSFTERVDLSKIPNIAKQYSPTLPRYPLNVLLFDDKENNLPKSAASHPLRRGSKTIGGLY